MRSAMRSKTQCGSFVACSDGTLIDERGGLHKPDLVSIVLPAPRTQAPEPAPGALPTWAPSICRVCAAPNDGFCPAHKDCPLWECFIDDPDEREVPTCSSY